MYKETFSSPYEQAQQWVGQEFEVIRVIAQPDETHDAEVLPMYEVKFPCGTTIEAWPEEVLA